MGEAKRKTKSKEKQWKEVQLAKKKFEAFKSFPAFTPNTGNDKLHAVKAYHHLMREIFLRAKHLHNSLINEIKNENSYTSFVLLKAYWETVAMLGYSFVSARNYIKAENYDELLKWVARHALGGKKYPPDELLEAKGETRSEYQQTNLITWMQKVDKDFNRRIGKGKKFSEIEKLYDEFIAEGGHPTFIGLSICEERQSDRSIIPLVDKTHNYDDMAMTVINLSIANLYFFRYWNEFMDNIEKQLESVE